MGNAHAETAQQQASQLIGTDGQGSEQECENPADSENRRDSLVISAPPVGDEHLSESSGKSEVESGGAAESAAVDPDLAAVIDAWTTLTARSRSRIVGIVRKVLPKD